MVHIPLLSIDNSHPDAFAYLDGKPLTHITALKFELMPSTQVGGPLAKVTLELLAQVAVADIPVEVA